MSEERELNIEPPVGYEIDREKSTFEKIVFKKNVFGIDRLTKTNKVMTQEEAKEVLREYREWLNGNFRFNCPLSSHMRQAIETLTDDRSEYLKGHKECGIQVGDTVKVVRKPSEEEEKELQDKGWDNGWTPGMEDFVGKKFEVIGDGGKLGFEIGCREHRPYDFPYTILEKVNEESPEERFWELADLESMTPYADWENHPGRLFWKNKQGEIVMEFDQKSGTIRVHYPRIWKELLAEFSYNGEDVRELIKGEVEKDFDLKGVTPEAHPGIVFGWWKNISI